MYSLQHPIKGLIRIEHHLLVFGKMTGDSFSSSKGSLDPWTLGYTGTRSPNLHLQHSDKHRAPIKHKIKTAHVAFNWLVFPLQHGFWCYTSLTKRKSQMKKSNTSVRKHAWKEGKQKKVPALSELTETLLFWFTASWWQTNHPSLRNLIYFKKSTAKNIFIKFP